MSIDSGSLAFPWDASLPSDSDQLRRYVASLYSLKKAQLYRLVFGVLRNNGDAEEIAQEAFLRFYEHLRSGRQLSGDPMNWLVCVARNMAMDRARRSRRENTRGTADWERIERRHCDASASPETATILNCREREIVRLIGTLSGLERECLILRLRGISFREIAASLNVSMSVVVEQTSRAIAKVKRRVRK